MHVELILEPAGIQWDGDGCYEEPFRRTSWAIWSKGQMLAASGHSYRHRKDALAALERVTGGRVVYETLRGRQQPIGLTSAAPDSPYGARWTPIERVQ